MKTPPTRHPEITITGSPREMGRQLGEAAGEQVRGFCAVAMEHLNRTVVISRDRAMRVAADCIPEAEAYSPDMMEELRGTAEAARVTLEELMLLQIRNQLQADHEAGCSSLSIAAQATAAGQAIVAQNWDNDPVLDEFTVVLTRKPTGKPSLMTATQAGLISYLGFNEHGIGACVNTLPAPAKEIGVPHYFILRAIYEARSLEEASAAVNRAQRAIPVNIMLATPQGPADFEITVDQLHVLRDEGNGYLAHTNHCLHADLLSYNDQFPELIDSHPRKCQLDALLEQQSGPFTVEDVQRILADHDNHPRSICRHVNDQPEHGFWKTVFSILIQPTAQKMHLTRGNPCEMPFEVYEMPDS